MKVFVIALLLSMAIPAAECGSAELDSTLFNGITARMIGPAAMSGRITAIDAVLENPDIIFVGSADGGVWKSTNGGMTFNHVFTRQAQSIGHLAIDQTNPDTVWVGTGECNVRNSVSVGTGLYRSDDGGETWEPAGLDDSERISKIVVDPGDSNTVYVAAMGHLWNSSAERGVYKTTDGGETWTRVLHVDRETGCADLELDPLEPDVLYASMWQFRRKPWFFSSGGPGSGLYRSTDGGETWVSINRGFPEGDLGRIAVAVAPSRSGTVYALVESEKTALYRSDTMGQDWIEVNNTDPVGFRPFYFSNLLVDPRSHKRVYVTAFSLLASTDGGKTVRSAISGRVHPDVHAIWINSRDPDHIIIGTDGGVYISHDRTRTFRFVTTLPLSQFYHVSCDMRRPYNIYGGLQDNGAWYGPSRSKAPGIANKEWRNIGTNDGMMAVRHPADEEIIYIGWQGGGLGRFNETTGETKDIQPLPTRPGEAYRFNWNAPFALSATDPEVIFTGAQCLFRSTDRGEEWETISPDLTTNDPTKLKQEESGGLSPENSSAENHCTISSISPSPLDLDLIWIGTDDGNVQLTRDSGRSWNNLRSGIDDLPGHIGCSSIESSHHYAQVAHATFDGHQVGDMKAYVYRTDDFGQTWQNLSRDCIGGYCHVVREDPLDPNLLFLGTELGLYLSLDRGRSWIHLEETLPPVSVRDIAIHPRDHDLIIATHGLGIWIIDDISPLRALTPETFGQEAHILPSRPAILEVPAKYQEFPGDTVFHGRNPQIGTAITYTLKKRHVFGDLTLEVIDGNGKVIKTLPATKNKGINRVYWDLRLKPPEVMKTPGVLHRFSHGPMVAEGTYRVRLTKGPNVYTGDLVVAPDPISAHSVEDREIGHGAVMKLYEFQNEIGYMSGSLADLIVQVERTLTEAAGKECESMLIDFEKRLAGFHGSIVQKGKQSFTKKLAEKVAWLYKALIQHGGRPTGSQLRYLALLEDEMDQARRNFANLIRAEREAVNIALMKEELDGLNVPEREGDSKGKD